MKLPHFLTPLFFLAASLWAQQPQAPALPEAHRILILGDSITYAGGYVEYLETALLAKHPGQHYEIIDIGLPSETVSGLSEEGHAGGKFPRPTLHERLDRVLAAAKADLVVACYGMNDGIYLPLDEKRFAAHRDGIELLRQKVLATGAKIIHLTPPVFDPMPIPQKLKPVDQLGPGSFYAGYDEVLARYSDWLIEQRAKAGWTVIDLHGPMAAYLAEKRQADPGFTLCPDGIHPNDEGHRLMARTVLAAWGVKVPATIIDPDNDREVRLLKLVQQKQRLLKDAWLTHTKHLRPGMKTGLPLDEARAKAAELDTSITTLLPETAAPAGNPATFPGKISDWNGYVRHDFQVAGKPILLVEPKTPAPGRPWVWHGEFFGHKPAPDIALLGKGFHIVFANIPNLLGCPDAVAHWDKVYAEMTGPHHLAPKVALVGLSRGGLYCYNWAIANPEKVSCIYGDAPVCDFKSWPGGKGKGKGSPGDWSLVLKLWHFKDDAEAMAYGGNPVDNLAPLAKAGVPLLHVYGDADTVVPWEENTKVIAERYQALGGDITLIGKPGGEHHPHGLEDPTPIIQFIEKNAGR